jgi:hypothetical protein
MRCRAGRRLKVKSGEGTTSDFDSMAEKKLSIGDRVEWNTSQGKTTGKIKKKLTSPAKIKTHKVAASPENPEFLVQTEKSKKLAAHKPAGLKKLK